MKNKINFLAVQSFKHKSLKCGLQRVRICQQNLETLKSNKALLEELIVTDELQVCDGKDTITIAPFFDINGIIYTHFSESGKAMTSLEYVDVLKMLANHLSEKRAMKKEWKILMDNASYHTSAAVNAALAKLRIERIPHPSDSGDLNPLDFYVFPALKYLLIARKVNNIEIKASVERCLSTILDPKASSFIINQIPKRWRFVQIDYIATLSRQRSLLPPAFQ